MRAVQRFSCKDFGHIAWDCPKKFCNYYKKQGHIISACPIRPERKQGTAYHASTGASSSTALPAASSVVPIPAPTALANPNTLTPEMVQQMIISAFGLSGNHTISSKPWYFDSGASNHMTNIVLSLSNVRNYDGNLKINTIDGSSLPISVVGDLSSSLTNVFVSPNLSTNLLSVGQLVDNNCNVNFSRSGCVVQDQVSGKMIAKGPKVGRLFPLHVSPSTIIPSFPLLSFACNVVGFGHKMWHRRLGHPNSDVLRTLFNSGLLGMHVLLLIFLSIVHYANLAKAKFYLFLILHLVPHNVLILYIVMFGGLHLLFIMHITNSILANIKVLCSDSGGEYMSNEFQDFLQSKGIISQRSCPSTPQQNGVAERKNRHLLDVVRTLLLDSSVPPRFWCEALSTAVHLINRLPSPMLNHVSPFSKLFGHSPLYSDLRTFGCVCFVHLPTHERHKLTAQSVKCAFLGYAIPHKGYVCYDPMLVVYEFPGMVQTWFWYERRSRHESNSTSSVPPSNLDPRLILLLLPPLFVGLLAMEHECWQNAMQAELQALEENHTWDIVPCPPTVKPIGSKWVFSVKLRSDGSLDRYKARLVALGNKQEYGVDYEETFAPCQNDHEEIYMKLPSGMTNSSPHDVCKLKRSLYGLKQAPGLGLRSFAVQFFPSALPKVNMIILSSSHICVGIVLLLVYVDDIIITGTDCSLITKLQQLLHTTFHMKDLGQLTYFLGLEDTSSVDTPMEVNVKYRKDEGDLLDDPTLYRRLVGSLIYLTTTRPDISYAVHQVSQFMTSPRHLHLAAVRCIIRYLRDTRRSTTGWCMFLGDALISWRCKKQDRVSKSSTEAEYRAMSTACSEIVWLRGLLEELGFPQTTSTPLHADNTSAIQIATNPFFMNVPSTLRLIVILFETPWKVGDISSSHLF
ncbi:Retrovirus-related Pol polyprotein from transposon RE1 [Vitis vinifera]|uniref:Retrovirus-related Pol polyprotein from transposon RE1 n=1 Tax=Vitis vinifera TaxID=29760 RepID=A0A438FGT5_VITVI|nr:Retrovirus-related Pol polyprotein from transposon RE1 [Vitis vinifera]